MENNARPNPLSQPVPFYLTLPIFLSDPKSNLSFLNLTLL